MGKNTIKEILTQPDSWRKTLKDIRKEREWLKKYLTKLKNVELVFTGCGTSYYLALSGASLYTKITGEKARGVPASDILLFPYSIFAKNSKYLLVPISRSGTTTEIVRVARYAKEKFGIKTLAISCRPDSELVNISDMKLIASDAIEKSVTATKSFTSTLLIIQIIAAIKAGNEDYENQLLSLPENGERIIKKYQGIIKEIAENNSLNKFIYLGQGPFYGLACEPMLEIKKLSCNSEAYHCLELRHGPESIVDSKTLVTIFLSDSGKDYETVLLKDVKELGAKTLVLCELANQEILNLGDYIIELNSGLSEYARVILHMPITQLLGYYKALAKGINPDNPKNLPQVVIL